MGGWVVGWLVGWLVGWMDRWMVGWLVGWLVDNDNDNRIQMVGCSKPQMHVSLFQGRI